MACEIPYDRCGEYNKKCPGVGRETTPVCMITDGPAAVIHHSQDDIKSLGRRMGVVTV